MIDINVFQLQQYVVDIIIAIGAAVGGGYYIYIGAAVDGEYYI